MKDTTTTTILRFPNEILLYFFRICRDHATEEDMDDIYFDSEEFFFKTHPILAISQTCSHWRTLTLASPDLWASIHVRFHESDDDRSGYTMRDTVLLYLERSANQPLDIDLRASNTSFWGPLHLRSWFTLIRHCSRWRHVTLFFYRDDTFVLPRMPLLESLTITKDETDYMYPRKPLGEMRRFEAPKLRRLYVNGTLRTGFSSFFDTRALTHVELNFFHITDLLNILRSAKNLVQVDFMGMLRKPDGASDDGTALTVGTVTSNLRELNAADLSPSAFRTLFRQVTLPSLVFLEVSGEEDCKPSSAQDQQTFYDFIERSNPPLTQFHFDTDLIPGRIGDVGRVLRILPSITTLGCHVKGEMQPALLALVKSREVLPNLEHLVLSVWEGFGMCESHLDGVLKDRTCGTGGMGGFKSFKLRCNPTQLNAQLEVRLKELEEQGLKIEWDIDPEWPYREEDLAFDGPY